MFETELTKGNITTKYIVFRFFLLAENKQLKGKLSACNATPA